MKMSSDDGLEKKLTTLDKRYIGLIGFATALIATSAGLLVYESIKNICKVKEEQLNAIPAAFVELGFGAVVGYIAYGLGRETYREYQTLKNRKINKEME